MSESKKVTDTTTISITLSGVDIDTSSTTTASSSDIYHNTTNWHDWEQLVVVAAEGEWLDSSPVYLGDHNATADRTLTYTYGGNVQDGYSGTSNYSSIENFDNIREDGTAHRENTTHTITTDLVTGESTSTFSTTLPDIVVQPSGNDSYWEPGSYMYFLTNPSEMDDGLKTGFYASVGVAGGTLALAGALAAAPAIGTFGATQFTFPAFGFGGNALALAGGGSATSGIVMTGNQIVIGTLTTTALFMPWDPNGPGIGTQAVFPTGMNPQGTWPAIMKDGKVYVHHFHNLANKMANGGTLGSEDLYGFALLDVLGKVLKVVWGG
ncbi:MAG: hypothetical protein R3C59_05710 [Planctomycetaceae bacterium]